MLPETLSNPSHSPQKEEPKNFYPLIIVFLMGIIIFLIVLSQIDKKKLNEQTFTAKSLAYELKNFESNMKDMQTTLEDMTVELSMKGKLLEEKNIELAYLTTHIKEIETSKKSSEDEIRELKQQLADARQKIQEGFATFEAQKLMEGLVYRVQIGMDVEGMYLPEKLGPLEVVDEGGITKYLIGVFTEYDDCLKMRDAFRGMGIADAWVVSCINGERVSAEQAAEYSGESQPQRLISETE